MKIQTLINAYKEGCEKGTFYGCFGDEMNDEEILIDEMASLSLNDLVYLIESKLGCEVYAYYDENDGGHGSLVDDEFTKKLNELYDNAEPDDPSPDHGLWDDYLKNNNLKDLDEIFTDKTEFEGASDPIFGYRLYIKT